MEETTRRATFALGIGAAATPVFVLPLTAAAQPYGPDEGKELAPGVRKVDLGKRASMIPAYKTLSMYDLIFQPGKGIPGQPMKTDMVCHIPEGELQIKQDDMQFTAKKGDVYSCNKGLTEEATNTGNTVAIMRVIELRTT